MQLANSSVTESQEAQLRQGAFLVLGGERSGWPGSSDSMPGAWNLSIVGRIKFWLMEKWGGHSWQMYQSWNEQIMSCVRDSKEMSWWERSLKDRSWGLKGTQFCSGAWRMSELQ